jgi:putative transposase
MQCPRPSAPGGQHGCLAVTILFAQPAQHNAIPRLLAFAPNEVWSWDITKLPLVRRGIYLSLYVVLDLFSRFVVAWMLSRKENSALAEQLMNEALARYGIVPGQLTLHQDRGSPMIAQGYLERMMELDVTCSHSRPRVSNDNPFSESLFGTLKYTPAYPSKPFDSLEAARVWVHDFVCSDNEVHRHSGIRFVTPAQRHRGG